jgi:hypothetical protein
MIRASYLQIYNENISDLLRTERNQLNIREDKKKGLYVEGLSEWAVRYLKIKITINQMRINKIKLEL